MKFLDMCILYCENSGKYFADNAFKNNKKKTVTKTYDKEKLVIVCAVCLNNSIDIRFSFCEIHDVKTEIYKKDDSDTKTIG